MTTTEILEQFYEMIKKNNEDDFNFRSPFEIEISENNLLLHELIEENYLEFVSLDLSDREKIKYTVNFSDKAIKLLY